MSRHVVLTIGLVIVAVLGASDLAAQSGYDLFQKALAAERADGNLRQAIQLYARVVSEFAGDRTLTARALVRMAECYEKLGERDAVNIYERVVREFADQSESAITARSRLIILRAPSTPQSGAPATRQVWGVGSDPMGSPSPDGRLLSFTDWETGDLAIRDLARGVNRRLTNTGGWDASGDYAEYSVISPDGRQVAYAWFRDKTSAEDRRCLCRYDLRVVPVATDRATPRIVHDNEDTLWIRPTAWTPDSRSIVVVRRLLDRTSQIGIVAAAGGSIRVLKSLEWRYPERVSPSPDGRFLAYDAPADANAPTRDIFVLALDGSREARVVDNPSHDHSPLWSPDGSEILFVSDRTGTDSLWRIPVHDGSATGAASIAMPNLGTGAFPLGMTREGSVYYSLGGPISNIQLVDLDADLTASTPMLATSRFFNGNTAPAWSTDGEHLAYLSRRGSSDSPGSTALVIRTSKTGEEREIPMNLLPADRVTWFPNGRSVLIASRDLARPRLAYHRVDLTTGTSELLHYTQSLGGIPSRRPVLSPDGGSMFYADSVDIDRFQLSRLMRFDLASKQTLEVRRLGDNRSFTSFALSPDGRRVAYIFYDGISRTAALHVAPLDGSAERELFRPASWTDATRYSGLVWSPDGRYILFATADAAKAEERTAIWKIRADGGTPEKVIAMKGVIRLPSLTGDGRSLAFAVSTPDVRQIWALEHFLLPSKTKP